MRCSSCYGSKGWSLGGHIRCNHAGGEGRIIKDPEHAPEWCPRRGEARDLNAEEQANWLHFTEKTPLQVLVSTGPFRGTLLDKLHARESAAKHDQGKLPWHMLPREALERILEVYVMGARKYGEDNWRQGLLFMRVWDAAQRHLWAWRDGEDLDPESGLSHLAHAAWNIITLLAYLNTHPEMDDRHGTLRPDGVPGPPR